MSINLPPELEAHVIEKARAEGVSVEAYIERLIREDEEWSEHLEAPLDETDPDFVQTRKAVLEALEQVERGESRPAQDVFAELRAKYGISR
jgi:formate dehydrogenase maturation protein FdhE